jgi:hypothetical protein
MTPRPMTTEEASHTVKDCGQLDTNLSRQKVACCKARRSEEEHRCHLPRGSMHTAHAGTHDSSRLANGIGLPLFSMLNLP